MFCSTCSLIIIICINCIYKLLLFFKQVNNLKHAYLPSQLMGLFTYKTVLNLSFTLSFALSLPVSSLIITFYSLLSFLLLFCILSLSFSFSFLPTNHFLTFFLYLPVFLRHTLESHQTPRISVQA